VITFSPHEIPEHHDGFNNEFFNRICQNLTSHIFPIADAHDCPSNRDGLSHKIGFVDGQRKIEDESFSRSRISLVKTSTHFVFDDPLPGKPLDVKPDRTAYLVEIRRGDAIKEVLIDAVTGQVLLS
jgi:hypothetical protein